MLKLKVRIKKDPGHNSGKGRSIRFQPGYLFGFLLLAAAEVFIALFVHDRFIRPYLGDVLVVLAIYCFLRILLPPYRLLPLGVWLLAAAVEVAQLFDFVTALGLEGSRFFRVLLGMTFDLADLACYFAGFVLLALWQGWRRRVEARSP